MSVACHPQPGQPQARPTSRASVARLFSLVPRPALLACLLLLALLVVPAARADGGHIALHRTQGSSTLTLFTAPNPLVPGPADLSVLVEDAETGAPVTDAIVEARLTANGQPPQVIPLTHAGSVNPLLLAGAPVFAAPGSYQVQLRLGRPGAPTLLFSTTLVVEPDHRRRDTLLFALVLPTGIVGLFLLNQYARRLGALRRVPVP